ncbi:hypothetical protein MRX96_004539 [Rhipicephalus microplus]
MATDADEDGNGTPTNIAGNAFVNTTTPKTYQCTAKAKTPTRASMVAVARGSEAQPEEELENESNEEEGIPHVKHQQFLGSRDTAIELCVTELAISGKGRGARGGRKKKTSTTVFIANIYSNPRHGKHKFKTLFHKIKSATSQAQKDLAKRGDAAAGRNLLEDAGEAEFTLLINPAHPSRIGTSAARDTNPDLTFAMLPEGGTAKWRNTVINLGRDHFIIEIELPLSHLNRNTNRGKTSKHKLVDWSKFRNTELGEVDNIDDWSAKLLAATKGSPKRSIHPKKSKPWTRD